MFLWCWQLTVVTDAASACPHNRLVPMKMNLGLKLVPQFIMLWTLHPTTKQLDLLNPIHRYRLMISLTAYLANYQLYETSFYSVYYL